MSDGSGYDKKPVSISSPTLENGKGKIDDTRRFCYVLNRCAIPFAQRLFFRNFLTSRNFPGEKKGIFNEARAEDSAKKRPCIKKRISCLWRLCPFYAVLIPPFGGDCD